MLAKVIRPKRRVAFAETRFDRRINYVCGKASAIALGNLAGAWTDAAFQMNLVAGGNHRIVRPCRHLVLSWGDGENPTDRNALAAARLVLREMGWQQHCLMNLLGSRGTREPWPATPFMAGHGGGWIVSAKVSRTGIE